MEVQTIFYKMFVMIPEGIQFIICIIVLHTDWGQPSVNTKQFTEVLDTAAEQV